MVITRKNEFYLHRTLEDFVEENVSTGKNAQNNLSEVNFEYYKQRRTAKLLQIENALTDKNAGK